MRDLTSFLLMSVDGVVEEPRRFFREDVYQDLLLLIGETIAQQDAVLLGRQMYDEWSQYWPTSAAEPFATFINTTPKYVVSRSPRTLGWRPSSLLTGDISEEIETLKGQTGKTIGVHGSITLVQSLLSEGLLDELRFILFPVVAGKGRRLFEHDGEPVHLDLRMAKSMPSGLQYLVFRPRK